MKEHVKKIALAIISVCFMGLLVHSEYNRENIAEETGLFFLVKDEVIRTWEKDGVQYLFLPSFAEDTEVTLAPYSKEFYIMHQKKKISGGENIGDVLKGRTIACQFLETGELFDLCIMQSENVPTLFIDTNSGGLEEMKEDKEYIVSGTVQTVTKDGTWDSCFAIKSIGGRGNTSFAGYDKKPYVITLKEEASLLGLPGGEKYALLSNASDPSLVRNDIARRMEMALGIRFAHAGQFVDLYVNGEYEGNYYLCDSMEVGKERINVLDMEAVIDFIYKQRNYESEKIYENESVKAREVLINPKDISGGYLMEREYSQRFEHEYEGIASAFITDEKEHFVVKSPQYCSVEQINYISDYVNKSEKAILSDDGKNPDTGIHYNTYIDVDSFVKKYLVEEVSKNYDAGVSSSFYYKDSDVNGGKLCAAPGWDYDMSLGNYVKWMEDFSGDPTGISMLAFHTYASPWYEALYQKEDFYSQVVSEYWRYLEPFLQQLLESGLGEYEDGLRASAGMNEVRWKEELLENPYYKNREQVFDDLYSFLSARKTYLDQIWVEEES